MSSRGLGSGTGAALLPDMRILALSPFVVVATPALVAALAAPVQAERRSVSTASRPTERVAALSPARTDHTDHADHADRASASSITGDLGITGARDRRPAPFLAAEEVSAEVRPYAPEIQRCYVEHLGDVRLAGRLDLRFVIGRDGGVVSLAAAAPGLPSRTAHKIQSCIRDAVVALRFPERRNDTTATVPYYFQHTNTPGGGPQESCWNPRGCH